MAILKSPKGIARYPYLNTPDTKFNPEGDYKVTLVLDNNDETSALVATLNAIHEEAIAKAKQDNPGKKIKIATLPINDEAEEGKTYISFKLRANVTPRNGSPFSQKPALVDAGGSPMTKSIFGGSVIKVAFEASSFYTATVGAGLTLRLKAVQVIELAAKGAGGDFGFEAVEGYKDDGIAEVAAPFSDALDSIPDNKSDEF